MRCRGLYVISYALEQQKQEKKAPLELLQGDAGPGGRGAGDASTSSERVARCCENERPVLCRSGWIRPVTGAFA